MEHLASEFELQWGAKRPSGPNPHLPELWPGHENARGSALVGGEGLEPDEGPTAPSAGCDFPGVQGRRVAGSVAAEQVCESHEPNNLPPGSARPQCIWPWACFPLKTLSP